MGMAMLCPVRTNETPPLGYFCQGPAYNYYSLAFLLPCCYILVTLVNISLITQ